MINLSEIKVDPLRNQRSLLPRPPLSLQGHSYHATHVLDEMDMAGQRERGGKKTRAYRAEYTTGVLAK